MGCKMYYFNAKIFEQIFISPNIIMIATKIICKNSSHKNCFSSKHSEQSNHIGLSGSRHSITKQLCVSLKNVIKTIKYKMLTRSCKK